MLIKENCYYKVVRVEVGCELVGKTIILLSF